MDCAVGHLRSVISSGMDMKPKHHLFLHLSFRARHYGSPAWYGTFLDESQNRVLASVCRSAYPTVFEQRVFVSFDEL